MTSVGNVISQTLSANQEWVHLTERWIDWFIKKHSSRMLNWPHHFLFVSESRKTQRQVKHGGGVKRPARKLQRLVGEKTPKSVKEKSWTKEIYLINNRSIKVIVSIKKTWLSLYLYDKKVLTQRLIIWPINIKGNSKLIGLGSKITIRFSSDFCQNISLTFPRCFSTIPWTRSWKIFCIH